MCRLVLAVLLASICRAEYSEADARQLLSTYCRACHAGRAPAAGLNLERLPEAGAWPKIFARVANYEMPPRGAPAPTQERREAFTSWLQAAMKEKACGLGITAGPAPIRRLNKDQYSATVRDLLNVHLDTGAMLPADGAGGEGFDNAAETLFLSPVHAEKYLDAAKTALAFAAQNPKSRVRFLTAAPGGDVTSRMAARRILDDFLPRAFRRPTTGSDVDFYLALFDSAQKNKQNFEDSILFALKGVLISPRFLFRVEEPNRTAQPRLLDDYALASRLSYFLWGSMPDSLLFALAKEGRLQDPEILRGQVARMLRNGKSFDFAQSFVEQWLGTRALSQSISPDPKLFPMYAGDEELRGDVRYQPVLFFREILVNDLSLWNLIDSNFTIATKKLQKLYGLSVVPPRKDVGGQPQRIELPPGSHRGGLLGMSAILAVSSHPQRTSPVLRGKWILDAMLGTPPPPPPPDVPALEESNSAAPRTVRELLAQHRASAVCATCHSRIDPLGFALENYDALGRWRDEEAGRPVDAKGALPDGAVFDGPDELKAALLLKKDVVVRNLAGKMLGYALGRGLTLRDSCVVDMIVDEVRQHDYSAQALVTAVVMSVPFRYQAEAQPAGK